MLLGLIYIVTQNLVLVGKLLTAPESIIIFVNTTNQVQLNDILMGTI